MCDPFLVGSESKFKKAFAFPGLLREKEQAEKESKEDRGISRKLLL